MASLVKYPGGKKNRGGYGTGKYYIKLWLPNTQKYKLIPTGTTNKKLAQIAFNKVSAIESLVKAENDTIRALFNDIKGDNKLLNGLDKEFNFDYSMTVDRSIEEYLNSCKKRVSVNTVKSYRLALRDLTSAIKGSTRLIELSKKDYDIILAHLQRQYNGTTINIRLRGIRAFILWLVENDYLDKIPFKVKQLKLKERLPKFLTPMELKVIYANVSDPVLLSIYKVYEGTGMRLSELKTTKLEGNFIRVIGKGDKERLIPLPISLHSDYQIAMAANYKTERISRGFTIAVRKANIKGNKSLHSLRHTYALLKLVELGEKHLVQELLGHSSVTVTEMYTKFPIDYLKEVYNSKLNIN